MLRVRARVATTHAIPAYGGIQLHEDAVRQIAEAMANGRVPMRFNHDLTRPLSAVTVAAGVEPTEDGHLSAWVEFDVDEREWDQYEKETQAAGAPGGMSFSTVEPFASRGNSPYGLTISADASYFHDDLIVAAAEEVLPGEWSVELARLYQFSWIPEPRVVFNLAVFILMSVPGNLLSSYLYDLANRFRARIAGQPKQPTFEFRVIRTPRSHTTEVKLTVADEDELRRAMREVPEILRAEGQVAYWDGTEGQWHQIPPENGGPN